MRYLSLSLIFFILSCTSCRKAFQISSIDFGSGGGFTGEISTFHLTQDGTITKDSQVVRKISRKIVFTLFSTAGDLNDYKYFIPGNTYSFIQLNTPLDTNRIVWSFGAKDLNPEVLNLYSSLDSLTFINKQ